MNCFECDLYGMKMSVRYSRVLIVTELVVIGTQCKSDPRRLYQSKKVMYPCCHGGLDALLQWFKCLVAMELCCYT